MARLKDSRGDRRASPWRTVQDAGRRGRAEALVAGRRPAWEALASGRALRLLLSEAATGAEVERLEREAAHRGVPVRREPEAALERLAAGLRHQGVVAVVRPYPSWDLASILARAEERGEAPLVVVAAGIEDPRNLGALARSAEGAGAHGLVVPARRAAPVSPAAARSAAGALEHLPVAVVPNAARAVAELKEHGVWVHGADAEGDASVWDVDWTLPSAIVVGNEGRGLGRLVRKTCDDLVSIPMRGGVASLNASVAAAVILYEAVRQRQARR